MKSPDDRLLESLGDLAREEEAAAAPEVEAPDAARRERLFATARAGLGRTGDGTKESTKAIEAKAPSRKPRVFAAAAGLALAAALALYFTTRTPPGPGPDAVASAAIPVYELDVSGGNAQDRSAPRDATRLVEGAPISLSLRPATRVEGDVDARAYLIEGDVVHPLDLAVTLAPGGAVRLSGTLRITGTTPEPRLQPGPAEIVVSLGRPGVRHDPRGTPVTQIVRARITLGDAR